jgi:NO-binding membrane sensor protein with MHYT domain
MVVLKIVYDPYVIALSALIGFTGAYGAVCTCEQFRLATVNGLTKRSTYFWIWLVACSFGGVCIWGMLFVGMASFRLMDGDTEIPMRYDTGNAFMLLVISLFLTFVAVLISTFDECFNRSAKEIVEKFVIRTSSKYTIQEIKQMGQVRMLYIVFTHAIERPVIGGIISGGAVGLMHYIGMMGMRFQGTIEYDPGVVFASCFTSVCVIIGGFWIFFRVLSLFPSFDILRIISACNGMFGISGLHYIGLQAATFHYDPDAAAPNPHNTLDRTQVLIGVLIGSTIYTLIILVYVLSDLRGWLLRTSTQLHHADMALASIQRLAIGRSGACIQVVRETRRYMRKHAHRTAVAPTGDEEGSVRSLPPRQLYLDQCDDDDTSSDNNRDLEDGGTRSHFASTTSTGTSPSANPRGRPHLPSGSDSDELVDSDGQQDATGSRKKKPITPSSISLPRSSLYSLLTPIGSNAVSPDGTSDLEAGMGAGAGVDSSGGVSGSVSFAKLPALPPIPQCASETLGEMGKAE